MKKTMTLLAVALVALTAGAKRETLLDDTDTWQMYTRPEIQFTELGSDTAVLGNLSVGWMLNDQLSVGPSVTMLVDDVRDEDRGDLNRFDLWYAGLRAEYTLSTWKLVHASASLTVAGGDASVSNYGDEGDDSLLVVEPGLSFAVNTADWVELGVGLSYRYVDGGAVGGYDENDLSGFSLGFFARFTEF